MQTERNVIVQARILRCGCWEFKLPHHGDAVLRCGPHAVLADIHGSRKHSVHFIENRWVWI